MGKVWGGEGWKRWRKKERREKWKRSREEGLERRKRRNEERNSGREVK